jgi:hypothetical protein
LPSCVVDRDGLLIIDIRTTIRAKAVSELTTTLTTKGMNTDAKSARWRTKYFT